MFAKHFSLDHEWLEKVSLSDMSENAVSKSWGAYYASQKPQSPFEISLSSMLPLFQEAAHSVAITKHDMDIARATTQLLNPGQIQF